MSGQSQGGNDTLIVTSGEGNVLYGDAETMQDDASGGNDNLLGGSGADMLYGDAAIYVGNETTGGNDMLNGGGGDDGLYGGGGRDKFVFDADSGNDTIHDFVIGEDEIDLSNYFGEGETPVIDVSQDGLDTVITLNPNDSIRLFETDTDDFNDSGSIIF